MDTPEKPVSESEAAEYLGIALETLRKHRRAREGPPYTKIGRRPVYLLSILFEWLRDGCLGHRRPGKAYSSQRGRPAGAVGVPLQKMQERLQQNPRRRGYNIKPERRRARDWRSTPRPAMEANPEDTEKPVN